MMVRSEGGENFLPYISYLIVSCCGGNYCESIVLDFDTLNVLYIKEMDSSPYNSLKIRRKSNHVNNDEYQEEFVCFFIKGEIAFYKPKPNF